MESTADPTRSIPTELDPRPDAGPITQARVVTSNKKTPPQPDRRGLTRAGKKAPIFWDSDGVDGGKSSLRVVLDWLSNPSNYDKWRGSDRANGKTKEALLKEIVRQLEAAGINHRDSAGVRENINNLEKQYREADDFLAGTGAGITDEKDLRAAIQKRRPYYYVLHDVMLDRPSARPAVTSDDLDSRTKDAVAERVTIFTK